MVSQQPFLWEQWLERGQLWLWIWLPDPHKSSSIHTNHSTCSCISVFNASDKEWAVQTSSPCNKMLPRVGLKPAASWMDTNDSSWNLRQLLIHRLPDWYLVIICQEGQKGIKCAIKCASLLTYCNPVNVGCITSFGISVQERAVKLSKLMGRLLQILKCTQSPNAQYCIIAVVTQGQSKPMANTGDSSDDYQENGKYLRPV